MEKEKNSLGREIVPPKGISPKIDAIRRLTKEIKRISNHFTSNPVHFHDGQAKLVLKKKINQRAELLEKLQEQDKKSCQRIKAEISEEVIDERT